MNGIRGNTVRFSLILFLLIVLIPACEKSIDSSIPYVPVNFQFNLTNYNDLTVDGNSVVFPWGYAGVIVTNSGFGFYACDAACPYEIDIQCRVVPEGAIATCPCCGSQYNLLGGGYVIKGPSSEPLKSYKAILTGGMLIVTN